MMTNPPHATYKDLSFSLFCSEEFVEINLAPEKEFNRLGTDDLQVQL